MIVNIFDETGRLNKELEEIIAAAAELSAELNGFSENCSVDILITDDESIKEINRDKRKIDTSTDVLSFPMADFSEGFIIPHGGFFLGDIVICYEKIFAQAEEYGHEPAREAGFLTAHGMLHLMGYDHIDIEDEKIMFELQEKILDKMGLHR